MLSDSMAEKENRRRIFDSIEDEVQEFTRTTWCRNLEIILHLQKHKYTKWNGY